MRHGGLCPLLSNRHFFSGLFVTNQTTGTITHHRDHSCWNCVTGMCNLIGNHLIHGTISWKHEEHLQVKPVRSVWTLCYFESEWLPGDYISSLLKSGEEPYSEQSPPGISATNQESVTPTVFGCRKPSFHWLCFFVCWFENNWSNIQTVASSTRETFPPPLA